MKIELLVGASVPIPRQNSRSIGRARARDIEHVTCGGGDLVKPIVYGCDLKSIVWVVDVCRIVGPNAALVLRLSSVDAALGSAQRRKGPRAICVTPEPKALCRRSVRCPQVNLSAVFTTCVAHVDTHAWRMSRNDFVDASILKQCSGRGFCSRIRRAAFGACRYILVPARSH